MHRVHGDTLDINEIQVECAGSRGAKRTGGCAAPATECNFDAMEPSQQCKRGKIALSNRHGIGKVGPLGKHRRAAVNA